MALPKLFFKNQIHYNKADKAMSAPIFYRLIIKYVMHIILLICHIRYLIDSISGINMLIIPYMACYYLKEGYNIE